MNFEAIDAILKATFVNVVDVEAACWLGHPPPGMEKEIIEIGIATVGIDDAPAKVTRRGTAIIKPRFSTISDFCTELTGITQAQANNGKAFNWACKYFREKHETDKHPWASWGDYDRKAIRGQCERRGIPDPFDGQPHINLKSLFAQIRNTKQMRLGSAIRLLGWLFEGRAHSGYDDSYNEARILIAMLPRLRELA